MLARLRLKCDGTRAETRFRLSAKRTSPFKSAGASVQSTTGSRGVRISVSNGSNAGYIMFRGSVKGTGYPLHSPVYHSLTLPCVTVFHHISTGLYHWIQNLYFFTYTIYKHKHFTTSTKDVQDSNSLRARRLRIQKPVKVRFFPCVQTGPTPIQLPVQLVFGLFPQGKAGGAGRGGAINKHSHLCLRLK